MLLAPVLVTTPEAVEPVMVPWLTPTNLPTVLLAPVLVTAPEALASVMVPSIGSDEAADGAASTGAGDRTRCGSTRDGAFVGSDKAADSAVSTGAGDRTEAEALMVPYVGSDQAADGAARTSASDRSEAETSVMVPSFPTKPPATLAAPTVTLPLACEPVMAPLTELEATSPPAMLASPACTLPTATDDRIVPALLPTKPPT